MYSMYVFTDCNGEIVHKGPISRKVIISSMVIYYSQKIITDVLQKKKKKRGKTKKFYNFEPIFMNRK